MDPRVGLTPKPDLTPGPQECGKSDTIHLGHCLAELQKLLWNQVGLLRDAAGLNQALDRIRSMRDEIADCKSVHRDGFTPGLQEWHDLSASLLVAETVTASALERTESRGAHQRADFEHSDPKQARHLAATLADGRPRITADTLRTIGN